jgi:hypothetical protein
MDYDPTKEALFHPESRDPTPGFDAGWPLELICAELSRLAYYKYEEDGGARLGAALRAGRFGDPRLFVSRTGDSQGFGTIADGTAYVAFRGTQPDSVSDLLADGSECCPGPAGDGCITVSGTPSNPCIRRSTTGWEAPAIAR